ncbi:hypothetical protein C8F04DRAFT_1179844 [Mycena alexandri]|uniref:Hyaluronan/mRNA-binding protein domain-containing protein n=1 Tax=Mycena alexandri TaxID=1745969 RepID=A0AAD6X7U5_9AGAR|nr:hypothetical protein C8F04DRAFT_1179844 [Mycena alexandri]
MSVVSKNPFALLEADEESSRPPSPVSAPAPAAPPAPARGAQKPRGGPATRGGKYYARGGAKAPEPAGNLNQNGIEDAPQDRKFDGRGRGRGGPRGAPRGRGRQFDKHSQTGKVDSEKKVNQGWGAEEGNAELKAEEAAINDASAEAAPAGGDWGAAPAEAAEWGAPVADAGDASAAPAADGAAKPDREGRPPRREREPEEEDNTLTLEQYLAQQKEKDSAIPKLEGIRKANEGADANIWKDVVALDKGEEESYFAGKGKAAPKVRAKKEEKVFLEIDARFERPRTGPPRGGGRGSDDRGGRGRGGAGRGRGAPRGAAGGGGRPSGNNNAAVNVDDEKAFPSLS